MPNDGVRIGIVVLIKLYLGLPRVCGLVAFNLTRSVSEG